MIGNLLYYSLPQSSFPRRREPRKSPIMGIAFPFKNPFPLSLCVFLLTSFSKNIFVSIPSWVPAFAGMTPEGGKPELTL